MSTTPVDAPTPDPGSPKALTAAQIAQEKEESRRAAAQARGIAPKAAQSSNGPTTAQVKPIWPPPYYFEDDLRRVRPYHWTYNTYCKERWRGRCLIEVFESEFRDRPVEYYRASMEKGDIFVNGTKVGPDYVLRNGDLVSHTLHRHEPPVTSDPIGILYEDDDMIVINKPSGVPVHPAGRYKFNSVLEIMKAERGPEFMPHPCNRLDRLTSGIMFVAKSVTAAEALGNQIKSRTVRKEYMARVVGEFPEGDIVCDQPILSISPKLGLNRVRAEGKTARTVFKRLAYYPPKDDSKANCQQEGFAGPTDEELCRLPAEAGDENNGKPWVNKRGYSIVRCLPVTGRTHQIRVHLQYLGHPIQNDPIYANQRVWGFNLGHNDADGTVCKDEDVISRLSRMGKEEVAQAVVYHDEMLDKYEKRRAEKMTGEVCDVCATPLYSDPGMHELSLWLHSLRYEDAGGAWSYKSPLPKWALPPEGMAGPTTVGGMDELVGAVKDEKPETTG
ncbi:DRAP deaminase [Metarhizium album ARSEF 1941]|uniref:Pseudouridine synthase n=1 Tax=Metarhizium album (strain ARSEF 1941) TaxID=1081103 RepID=A0A0B2WMQ3_METAS|nr:DRAP deaminase [Metarhizium album ARSEF 1941]KHN95223.1 DRAP deaminase [Metarhizium album ARSEF 1941]